MGHGSESDSEASVTSVTSGPAMSASTSVRRESTASEQRRRQKSPSAAGATTAGSPTMSRASMAASTSTTATKATTTTTPAKKRKESTASEANGGPAAKITKRRAARACVSCRARKVRCDVVEGAPCGNCRWDNVECVVQESRRRKKNIFTTGSIGGGPHHMAASAEALRAKTVNPISITSADLRRPSEASAALSAVSVGTAGIERGNSQNGAGAAAGAGAGGGPGAGSGAGSAGGAGGATLMDPPSVDDHARLRNLIYQQQTGFRPEQPAELLSKLGDSLNNTRLLWQDPPLNPVNVFGDIRTAQFLNSLEEPDLSLFSQLPGFVKPLPGKIAPEDVKYLHAKGALTLPDLALQNALLQAYVEYVHPFMPLIELHDFLNAIHSREGLCGQISLFLYHAVMFAATAFVDMRHLREAGYVTRKAARKFYFSKTRLLYDFDYESDRLVLVQALLLMTYWYETPDDQKDTWHWMGVAISLAHTIGLHRDPANTNMAPRKQRLWKRIWWSCFMRDRLVALGMRRPTRIKDEDYDVPMLAEADFEIEALSEENQLLPADCALVRDLGMQRELAALCVQKARLCELISEMLKAQYSVLIRDATKPVNTTNSTMMLFPNKTLENLESINTVDAQLTAWLDALPPAAQYRPLTRLDVQDGRSTLAVQRNLLHMVYYTTVSALHRPQFLPSSPLQVPTASRQVQDMSRMRVRESAARITHMAAELHQLRLERFLPTTGVTVILPAMIIHLLEMKNPLPEVRVKATKGFRQCLRVMERLRDIYAAADFATLFLDAALRKAAIDLSLPDPAAGIAATAAAAAAENMPLNMQQQLQLLQRARRSGLNDLSQLQLQQHHQHVFGLQPHQQPQQIALRRGSGADGKPATIAPGLNLADRLSTPPPDNAPYLNPTEVGLFQADQPSFAALQAAALTTSISPAALAAAAAVAAGQSPPHTERDLDSALGLTPSVSGGSSGGDGGDVASGLDMMDVSADFGTGHHDEFDWTAVTGTTLDFDQWLQFPADGVSSSSTAAAATTAAAAPPASAPPSGTVDVSGSGSGETVSMQIDGGIAVPVPA